MRLNARAPIIIRGDEITHLDADGYKHLPRAASLPDGKILASSGGAWRPSDLSGVSVSSVFGRTGAVAAQTGDYTAEQVGALAVALKGAANGVAELDAMGRVPSGQLPSYVDDVIEVANFAALPGTGEAGKIYITLDDNKTWRWSGSGYAEISASLALGETSSTAYRGDRGKTAYDHSQAIGNPHGTVPSDIGAARAPATYELSGNAGIGAITASAIKVLVDGATISLSLGADGQAWDVICPDYAVEFYVPNGAKLYRYNGITTGPATYSPGGGRAIRVVRVDATTWLMPNLS